MAACYIDDGKFYLLCRDNVNEVETQRLHAFRSGQFALIIYRRCNSVPMLGTKYGSDLKTLL